MVGKYGVLRILGVGVAGKFSRFYALHAGIVRWRGVGSSGLPPDFQTGVFQERRLRSMAAKSLTKSEIATQLAERVGISKKQATQFFMAQAELAYRHAKNVFTIPGIGKIKLVDKPARKMKMPFGPNAGKEIMIPKKKKVKFLFASAAKEAMGLKR